MNVKEIKNRTELFKTNLGDWIRPSMLFVNKDIGSREHGVGLVVNVDNSDGQEIEVAFREGSEGIRVWRCWAGEGINPGSSYITYMRKDEEFAKYDIMLLEAEAK